MKILNSCISVVFLTLLFSSPLFAAYEITRSGDLIIRTQSVSYDSDIEYENYYVRSSEELTITTDENNPDVIHISEYDCDDSDSLYELFRCTLVHHFVSKSDVRRDIKIYSGSYGVAIGDLDVPRNLSIIPNRNHNYWSEQEIALKNVNVGGNLLIKSSLANRDFRSLYLFAQNLRVSGSSRIDTKRSDSWTNIKNSAFTKTFTLNSIGSLAYFNSACIQGTHFDHTVKMHFGAPTNIVRIIDSTADRAHDISAARRTDSTYYFHNAFRNTKDSPAFARASKIDGFDMVREDDPAGCYETAVWNYPIDYVLDGPEW